MESASEKSESSSHICAWPSASSLSDGGGSYTQPQTVRVVLGEQPGYRKGTEALTPTATWSGCHASLQRQQPIRYTAQSCTAGTHFKEVIGVGRVHGRGPHVWRCGWSPGGTSPVGSADDVILGCPGGLAYGWAPVDVSRRGSTSSVRCSLPLAATPVVALCGGMPVKLFPTA